MGVFSSGAEPGCDLARLRALAAALHFDMAAGFPASARLPAVLFGLRTRPGGAPRLMTAPRHDGRRHRRHGAARDDTALVVGAAC